MKSKNLVWGLFFLVAAVLVILNQTGVFVGISIWSLAITLLLIPVIVSSIRSLSFPGIFFPLAILAILFDEPLGIEKFTPWPVLGCALFLSIGLMILFPQKHRWDKWKDGNESGTEKYDNSQDWQEESSDGEHIFFNNRFTGSVKYVTSNAFHDVNIKSSFGGMKVYFDNAQMDGDTANGVVYAEFSGIELYVPRDWTVVNQISCSFGGVDEKGLKGYEKSGKKLILKGNTKFSGVSIIYV